MKHILLTTLFIFVSFNISCKENINFEPIVSSNKTIIHSSILNQNRELFITLPKNYYDSNMVYPVVYNLDGYNLFELTSSLIKNFSSFHAIPEMIVVGINQKNRYKELMRPGSNDFLEYINKDVAPFVESNFRTSSQKIIVGHSLGATFVLDALLNKPNSFDSYIAISPVINTKKTPSILEFEVFFKKNKKLIKNIYVSKGNEQKVFKENIPKLISVLKSSYRESNWTYKEFPNKSHGTVVLPSLIYSFEQMFSDYMMPEFKNIGFESTNIEELLKKTGGINKIKKYYENLSKVKGFKINYPTILYSKIAFYYANNDLFENLINFVKKEGKNHGYVNYYVGTNLITKGKLQEAIKLFLIGTQLNPKSSISWNSLAEAYKGNKEYRDSIKCYEKAIYYAELNSNKNVTKYVKNKEDVSKLLL